MKGSVQHRKNSDRWYVTFYHQGKVLKLYYYKGEKIYHRKIAQKLLAMIQADYEEGKFYPEKYGKEKWTDVVPYLLDWLEILRAQVPNGMSPATWKDYRNSINNHLIPYFKNNPVMLHEIKYDTLQRLLVNKNRSGKGRRNVLYCLRACLDFAWRSNRIDGVPPFPKRKEYGIQEKIIQWLPSERQEAVINAIPIQHQPIFWWLKYHYRRPV